MGCFVYKQKPEALMRQPGLLTGCANYEGCRTNGLQIIEKKCI